MLLRLCMGLSFLALELGRDLQAKGLRVLLLDGRRQRERECRLLDPLRILWIEICGRAQRVQHSTTEVTHIHLDARPFARVPNQASSHRVREHVGDLLYHRRLRHELYHARGLMVPYWPFPLPQHLGAQCDQAMVKLQEARQHALHIGHDQVQMC
ncbi:hypothetical protein BE21_16805 [Sorangium cellulosum]|uniref:Uncharacterized protein n=1 Tax=Sorangium cellulosum TaxID=56 RepID=A0A150TY30_SORCE|nr:hypothetical protein BE21_16805 [Sorangium cellulosum]